jgi:chemotaxis protein CheX
MDIKYVDPFIEATINVLGTIAFTKAEAGKPFVKEDNLARGDVSALVELIGDMKATVSASFTEQSILNIVTNMFQEEMTSLDDEVKDAAGEIVNIISGQARQRLSEMGRHLQAAIPIVITGERHTITHITEQNTMAIPFQSDVGEFTIEVCLEDLS